MKRKLQGVRRRLSVNVRHPVREPRTGGGLTSPSKNGRLVMWASGWHRRGQGPADAGVIRRGAARPAPAAPPWDPASPLFFEKEMDKGCFVNERSQYLIENKGSASENEPKTNPN